MRGSIPEYAKLTCVLNDALERFMKLAKSLKKARLSKVSLTAIEWDVTELHCLDALKHVIVSMVPLAHLKADADVCLVTEAIMDY